MPDGTTGPSAPESPQPNRGGRPRIFQEPGVKVMTYLPESQADRLMEMANRRGESVSEIVRKLLIKRLQ